MPQSNRPIVLPPLTIIIPGWMNLIYQLISTKPIDPYACWGLMTGFRALRHQQRLPSVLTFAVELDAPYSPGVHDFFLPTQLTLAGSLCEAWKGLPAKVPSAYANALPAGSTPRFVTLRLNIHKNNSWEAVHAYVQQLILTSYVKRLHIGLPLGVNNPDREDGHAPTDLPDWAPKSKVVIGVIDDVCPYAHRAIRTGSGTHSTRLIALWDQTTVRGYSEASSEPMGFPYGAQWSHAALDTSLRRQVEGQEVDEEAVYASGDIHAKPWRRRASHAAAVMGLLAGAGQTAPRMPQTPDAGDVPQSLQPLNDEATKAPIVMVQLPSEQVSMRAGRWLGVNALDGLQYLVGLARHMRQPDSPLPLVVNMSYGATAGPHDGTGMFEAAIDELCTASNDSLAVVVAAGNSHGTRRCVDDPLNHLPGGAHARQSLEAGGVARFSLFIPPDKQFETYFELWFSVPELRIPEVENLVPNLPGISDGEVEIEVVSPNGQRMSDVQCPGIAAITQQGSDEEIEAGLFFMRMVSQGEGRSMALLVVAPTHSNSGGVEACSGCWRITVRHKLPKGDPTGRHFMVDAWVERDDTDVGAVRPQSAKLVENDDGSPDGLTDMNTFTHLATGRQTFRASALMDQGDGLVSEKISAYSAAAIGDACGPEFSAIADTHAALPGIRVSGSQSGMVVRANGTSMAAPQAARYLVNEMANGRTPTDVRSGLPPDRGNARLGKKTV